MNYELDNNIISTANFLFWAFCCGYIREYLSLSQYFEVFRGILAHDISNSVSEVSGKKKELVHTYHGGGAGREL